MKFKKSKFIPNSADTRSCWRALNDHGFPISGAPTIIEQPKDCHNDYSGFRVGPGGELFSTLSEAKSEVKRQLRSGGFF